MSQWYRIFRINRIFSWFDDISLRIKPSFRRTLPSLATGFRRPSRNDGLT